VVHPEAVDEAPENLVLSTEVLLLGARLEHASPPVFGAMLGLGYSLPSAERLLRMLTENISSVEDADLIDRFMNSNLSANEIAAARHRVAISMEIDVALDIDAALVDVVDFGDVAGQRSQGRLLRDPQGTRRCSEMTSVFQVRVVAPGTKLGVTIIDIAE